VTGKVASLACPILFLDFHHDQPKLASNPGKNGVAMAAQALQGLFRL